MWLEGKVRREKRKKKTQKLIFELFYQENGIQMHVNTCNKTAKIT